MASWGLSKYIETKLQTILLSPHIKLFQKIKRGLHLIFCTVFEEKYFFCYIPLIDQISLSRYLYFMRHWAICLLQLFANQVVASWILKLTLPYLSNQSLFPHSFLQGWNPLLLRESPFLGTPLFLKQVKKVMLLFLRAIQIGACKLHETL